MRGNEEKEVKTGDLQSQLPTLEDSPKGKDGEGNGRC